MAPDQYVDLRDYAGVTKQDNGKLFINPNADFVSLWHRLPKQLIRGRVLLRSHWNRSFTFCFVRNPFDRLVSCWHAYNHMRKRMATKDIVKSFDAFAWEVTSGKSKWVRPPRYILRSPFLSMVQPQVNWTDGHQFDHIGRLEHLTRDWNYICRQIGVPQTWLLVTNATRMRLPYCEYYKDKALKRQVTEYYEQDLSEFGYEF
jgi:hypothetical protein